MAKSSNRSRVTSTTVRPLTVRPALPTGGRLPTGGLLTSFAGNPERFNRGDLDRQNPNFGPDGERHDEHDRKPRYRVELMARTYFGDLGVRPVADPNLVFWESPDIWIDGPSGDPDQATPGVTNTVNVHVWNVGLADCWAAHVDLYWCDPSVGVTPALAQSIGSTVVSLMGGEHKVVPFQWVPTLANGGHECLVAQVYDPVSDPVIAPFSPTLDRHVCQRNISVVTAPLGQAFEFIVSVPNLSRSSATSVLSAELLSGQARRQFFHTIGAAEAPVISRGAALAVTPRFQRAARSDGGTLARASGAFREALDPEPSRAMRRQVAGSLQALAMPRGRAQRLLRGTTTTALMPRSPVEPNGKSDLAATRAVTVEPGYVVQVAIEGLLPRKAGPEGRDVYRVVERVEGRVTGGVTVIVKASALEETAQTERKSGQVRKRKATSTTRRIR